MRSIVSSRLFHFQEIGMKRPQRFTLAIEIGEDKVVAGGVTGWEPHVADDKIVAVKMMVFAVPSAPHCRDLVQFNAFISQPFPAPMPRQDPSGGDERPARSQSHHPLRLRGACLKERCGIFKLLLRSGHAIGFGKLYIRFLVPSDIRPYSSAVERYLGMREANKEVKVLCSNHSGGITVPAVTKADFVRRGFESSAFEQCGMGHKAPCRASRLMECPERTPLTCLF